MQQPNPFTGQDLSETFQIDEAIPLEEQKRYFISSQATRSRHPRLSTEELNDIESLIYKREMGEGWHRNTLILLAATGQIEAYRILEDFLVVTPKKLKNWATIAEFDGRIGLEASLSDKQGVTVITSGLGGHNGLMRFMLISAARQWEPLKEYQRDLMLKEFSYAVKNARGEIEEISTGDAYLLMTFLLPLGLVPDPIFHQTVAICNEFGDFLAPENLFITNVNRIEENDIIRIQKLSTQEDLS